MDTKEFDIGYVLSSVRGADLVVFGNNLIHGCRDELLEFLIGKGMALKGMNTRTAISTVINEIFAQYPELKTVNFKEMEARLDQVPFVSVHVEGQQKWYECRQKHLKIIREWVDEQATKLGRRLFNFQPLPEDRFPRTPNTFSYEELFARLAKNGCQILPPVIQSEFDSTTDHATALATTIKEASGKSIPDYTIN